MREEGEGGQHPAPRPRRHVGRVGDVDPDTPEQLLPDIVLFRIRGQDDYCLSPAHPGVECLSEESYHGLLPLLLKARPGLDVLPVVHQQTEAAGHLVLPPGQQRQPQGDDGGQRPGLLRGRHVRKAGPEAGRAPGEDGALQGGVTWPGLAPGPAHWPATPGAQGPAPPPRPAALDTHGERLVGGAAHHGLVLQHQLTRLDINVILRS